MGLDPDFPPAIYSEWPDTNMMPKNTICLWYDKDAHDAARFYAATFPDSKVTLFTMRPETIRAARKAMC